jgi:hypothetical protein
MSRAPTIATVLVLAALPARGQDLLETFAKPLGTERWELLRVHDTREDKIEATGGKLVVALDTIGTIDSTVKTRGVRSRASFELGEGLSAAATIDWNDQVNGCYLSAGLALVLDEAAGDPHEARDAIAFEWIGVPPGKNVRPSLWRRKASALVPLYNEGWPQPRREDRVGRLVKRSRIAVEVAKDRVRLTEDGRELFQGKEGIAGKARLVLFVTGHSNYGERTVLFEDVRVARTGEKGS